MTLGSMASNRYSAPFREDVNGWITKLSTVTEIVEQWLMVQSMWMYMEAVFSGGDIVKQLPQEAKRFQNIDKSFMKVRCIHVNMLAFCLQFSESGAFRHNSIELHMQQAHDPLVSNRQERDAINCHMQFIRRKLVSAFCQLVIQTVCMLDHA